MSQLFLSAGVFPWVILEVGGVIKVEWEGEEFLPHLDRLGQLTVVIYIHLI